MTRTSLPIQQSLSNALCIFCDSAGVFSKQDLKDSKVGLEKWFTKSYKETLTTSF